VAKALLKNQAGENRGNAWAPHKPENIKHRIFRLESGNNDENPKNGAENQGQSQEHGNLFPPLFGHFFSFISVL
jgi:hypothetical protein